MKESDYKVKPPVAAVKTKVLENFNVKRYDDYYWLNEKSNPEVLAYLNAENSYKDMVMEETKQLQDTIYHELLGRIKEEDESYPNLYNGYYYYSRTIKGKQYAVILRKKGSLDAKEEVIFDINKMAEGTNAYIFGSYTISPDNKLAAYSYNTTGSYAEFTLKIKDLESEKELDFSLEDVASFEWANDNATLFYSKIDSTLRSCKIYKQNIYEKNEVLVYEEKDEKYSSYVFGDHRHKFIYISSFSATTSEERFISADNPEEEFKVFLPRKHKTEYSIEPHIDDFFVKYKDEDNLNSKIYKAPYKTYSDMSTWTEVIPHDDKVFIEGAMVLKDYLVTTTRENGLKQINILHLNDNNKVESIKFPETVYHVGLGANRVFDASTIRYSYSSLKRPATLYEYDVLSGKTKTLKVQKIPSGFEPDDYEVERLMVKADDGIKVPMAVVYKKGLKKDGSNPTLLYGYGSYGANTNPSFNSTIFSLVDRGYIFAMAQIRGGSEMGEQWYQDGKLMKKKNTFTDFISCSEHLINEKYTNPNKLSIMGGSAGGLLMGAVTNMRPDLYNCVLAIVPFVDVVTSMLDDTLPLTTGEYEEWGNPNIKEDFDYMLSYSPYDNIEAKDYPNMLVTGGLNDSQVLYHEPAKYTAKLRKMKTDDNVLIMHMDMDSGHGGATGRYNRLKDIAFEYSFIIHFTDK